MKKLYITVISESGDRQNVRADMPTVKPRRADYDQHAILRGRYEVHFYARGMAYSEQETAALVSVILNEPLSRAALIGRPVPLENDSKFPLLLVADEFGTDKLLIVQARFVGNSDDVEILNTPMHAPKASYPLDMVFGTYQAAGFIFHQIPHDAQASAPSSAGYVGIHESAGVEWEPAAAVFLQWLHDLNARR